MENLKQWHRTSVVILSLLIGVGECFAQERECNFSALIAEARASGCEAVDAFSSSWVDRLEYCSSYREGALLISTKASPATYIFQGVPQAMWTAFKAAPSKGTFYSQTIRGNPRFRIRCE